MTDSSADPNHALPIACSLSGDGQQDRVAEWSDALGAAIARDRIVNGIAIHFPANPSVAARLARLASLEHHCCPFFTFTLGIDGGMLALTVTAPADAQHLLTEIFDVAL